MKKGSETTGMPEEKAQRKRSSRKKDGSSSGRRRSSSSNKRRNGNENDNNSRGGSETSAGTEASISIMPERDEESRWKSTLASEQASGVPTLLGGVGTAGMGGGMDSLRAQPDLHSGSSNMNNHINNGHANNSYSAGHTERDDGSEGDEESENEERQQKVKGRIEGRRLKTDTREASAQYKRESQTKGKKVKVSLRAGPAVPAAESSPKDPELAVYYVLIHAAVNLPLVQGRLASPFASLKTELEALARQKAKSTTAVEEAVRTAVWRDVMSVVVSAAAAARGAEGLLLALIDFPSKRFIGKISIGLRGLQPGACCHTGLVLNDEGAYVLVSLYRGPLGLSNNNNGSGSSTAISSRELLAKASAALKSGPESAQASDKSCVAWVLPLEIVRTGPPAAFFISARVVDNLEAYEQETPVPQFPFVTDYVREARHVMKAVPTLECVTPISDCASSPGWPPGTFPMRLVGDDSCPSVLSAIAAATAGATGSDISAAAPMSPTSPPPPLLTPLSSTSSVSSSSPSSGSPSPAKRLSKACCSNRRQKLLQQQQQQHPGIVFEVYRFDGMFDRKVFHDAKLCHYVGRSVLPFSSLAKYRCGSQVRGTFTLPIVMRDSSGNGGSTHTGMHFAFRFSTVSPQHCMIPASTDACIAAPIATSPLSELPLSTSPSSPPSSLSAQYSSSTHLSTAPSSTSTSSSSSSSVYHSRPPLPITKTSTPAVIITTAATTAASSTSTTPTEKRRLTLSVEVPGKVPTASRFKLTEKVTSSSQQQPPPQPPQPPPPQQQQQSPTISLPSPQQGDEEIQSEGLFRRLTKERDKMARELESLKKEVDTLKTLNAHLAVDSSFITKIIDNETNDALQQREALTELTRDQLIERILELSRGLRMSAAFKGFTADRITHTKKKLLHLQECERKYVKLLQAYREQSLFLKVIQEENSRLALANKDCRLQQKIISRLLPLVPENALPFPFAAAQNIQALSEYFQFDDGDDGCCDNDSNNGENGVDYGGSGDNFRDYAYYNGEDDEDDNEDVESDDLITEKS